MPRRKSAKRKKRVGKTIKSRTTTVVTRKSSIGTALAYKKKAVKVYENQLGDLEVRRFNAKKKSIRRKIAKKIALTKSQLRKLK